MARRRQRAKGSGSVYKTKDGWCAQREAPRRDDGKRRYERRFFATRAEAIGQTAAWEKERIAARRHPRATDSVRAWCQQWLVNKARSVTPSTLAFYRRHLAYITPEIGDRQLYELDAQHIRDALDRIAEHSALSPQSRKHIRTVLSMALELAVKDGVIPRNPVATVDPPLVKKYEAVALSDEQLAALFAAVAGTRLEPLWHLLADYGMRLDELLSCRWPDYDVAAGTLRIRATKTDTERRLTLTEAHVERLAAWREALAVEREDSPRWREQGYLFPSEAGTKLLQSNVRRAFKDAIDRANATEVKRVAEGGAPPAVVIPRRVRVHDLRHTAATNLIAAGNDIPTVQYITGHKDTKVLLEIYAHYQQGRDRAAVEAVEAKRKKQG